MANKTYLLEVTADTGALPVIGGILNEMRTIRDEATAAAVIESGSVAGKGSYTKWSDGTMECSHTLEVEVGCTTALPFGGFSSPTQAWEFPQTFFAPPDVCATPLNLSAFGTVGTSEPTLVAYGYAFTTITSHASASRSASLIARGRWKA